ARLIAETLTRDDLRDALAHARDRELPVFVLGGGSNVVVSDAGFDGMVIRVCDYRLELEALDDGRVRVLVGAGVEWDELVAFTVAERLAGIECLSGIPGQVGAAPIQNIGAYGQEVAECIEAVHVVDRATGTPMRLPAEACAFGYRDSRFKGEWRDRYVVTQVDLVLQRDGAPTVRYDELRKALRVTDDGPLPRLDDVRTMVLRIRRRKSMVLDPTDP
ncbi:MAG: FAD-binding protein, partial [Rhodocyclaceae bacterium]|nr:FAD-binding protein [Rhodocyclaceae bacterium]